MRRVSACTAMLPGNCCGLSIRLRTGTACRPICGAGCAEFDQLPRSGCALEILIGDARAWHNFWTRLRGVGTVTEVGRATRVVIAASGTAVALAVGAVGVVLAVDDRQRPAANVTNPSASGVIASATQPTPTPSPTQTVPPPPPLLLPNMRSLNAS